MIPVLQLVIEIVNDGLLSAESNVTLFDVSELTCFVSFAIASRSARYPSDSLNCIGVTLIMVLVRL
jgi:hypothetical protein